MSRLLLATLLCAALPAFAAPPAPAAQPVIDMHLHAFAVPHAPRTSRG